MHPEIDLGTRAANKLNTREREENAIPRELADVPRRPPGFTRDDGPAKNKR